METGDWLSLLAVLGLLVLSGFFSGSETALTAASEARIHALAAKGDKRAQRVEKMTREKDRLIGAILLGNNLANILASALATSALIALAGEAGVVYATLAMTTLVVIFAEVAPKVYAISHADRAALAVARPIAVVVALFAPVVSLVRYIVNGMFRLVGVRIGGQGDQAEMEEELRGAIELHGRHGDENEDERLMLRSILDLGDVTVGEIMIHRRNVEMLDIAAPPADVVARAQHSPFTRLPLYREENDQIVGVLHVKALFRALRERDGDPATLDFAALAADPWFIPDATTLLDQLKAFRQRREHFALVVDEYGDLQGAVTLEDILEEIVGEIDDEHDQPVRGCAPQSDGSFLVDGWVTIRDLNRRFDWRLPDDDASTIAGLVLHEARRIPDVGQDFVFHDFRFRVLRKRRNQITLMRMTPMSADAPAE